MSQRIRQTHIDCYFMGIYKQAQKYHRGDNTYKATTLFNMCLCGTYASMSKEEKLYIKFYKKYNRVLCGPQSKC